MRGEVVYVRALHDGTTISIREVKGGRRLAVDDSLSGGARCASGTADCFLPSSDWRSDEEVACEEVARHVVAKVHYELDRLTPRERRRVFDLLREGIW